ncbi:MAG TPA: hypothetical protein DCS93_35160 [Microscillaceae bacterium]|nr:hypothetical protein [Microscillaceae bacterium]
MKAIKLITLSCITLIKLSACEKLFLRPNPPTDPLSIFNEYIILVKQKYAMLDAKNVDIDALADSLRSTIPANINEQQLFIKLKIIVERLKDGHSSLIEDQTNPNSMIAQYDLLAGFPPGIDINILFNNYLNKQVNSSIKTLDGGEESDVGFRAIWGRLPDHQDIAYIWIPSWNVTISDEEIEIIFSDIKGTKGLIFDQRLNNGGDPSLAAKFASYFTDKPVYIGFEKFKVGPQSNDFADSPATFKPTNSINKYLKPVMVVTDRNVFSAATSFCYSVDPLPQITFIGQRTGGGSGSVADGWYWGLSVSEFIDAKNHHLDNGFEPDIAVILDTTNKIQDEVIERALQELR